MLEIADLASKKKPLATTKGALTKFRLPTQNVEVINDKQYYTQ